VRHIVPQATGREHPDVRQFGSARDGLREWRLQRLTAIAVIPLSLHFAGSILSLAISDRKTAADWLALPVPALLVILLVLAGIVHALIGVHSVILDYVHARARLLALGYFRKDTGCQSMPSLRSTFSREVVAWSIRRGL
jgi:succinate dehydrogenase / fumarate reductase membrane anchor subunit